jgi:hypothetical protein
MGWVVNATPRPLYPRERPINHCTGGWVGPRVGLDRCGKSHLPPEFDPRTVQPVATTISRLLLGVCVVRRFRRCANVIECTYTNLDSIAYYTANPNSLTTHFSERIPIVNPLNAELNPISHLLALLGGATIVVVSRLRVATQDCTT